MLANFQKHIDLLKLILPRNEYLIKNFPDLKVGIRLKS